MENNNKNINKEYEIIEVKDYSNVRLVLDAIGFGAGIAMIICSAIALNDPASIEQILRLIDVEDVSKKMEVINCYRDLFGIGVLMGFGFSGIEIFDMYKIIYAKYPKIREKIKKVFESIDNYSNKYTDKAIDIKQKINERKERRR